MGEPARGAPNGRARERPQTGHVVGVEVRGDHAADAFERDAEALELVRELLGRRQLDRSDPAVEAARKAARRAQERRRVAGVEQEGAAFGVLVLAVSLAAVWAFIK